MAESRPPAGGPGQTWDDGSGVTQWLRRWRDRLPAEDRTLPENEARLVVEAVLDDLAGRRPDNLDRAGRAWGRAHRSVSEMVGRLSSFREALAATGVDDPLRMHRALDRVTAGATEEVLHRLEHASRTDALTGVGNRRALDETLSAALSAASRQGHDVTVVAVDLDGLKRINDTEGHAAGDAALLALVRSFYVALRDEDTVFRLGGDEFAIVLPFTSVGAAELLMERIHSSGAPAFTWGAAGYPGSGADAPAMLDAADHDLYRRRLARRGPALVDVASATAPRAAAAGVGAGAAAAFGRVVTLRRPARSASSDQSATALRWAWIPAAAVLVVSLIATLLASSSPGNLAKGAGQHSTPPANHGTQPVTAPQGQGTTTPPASGPGTSSTGSPFLTASFTQPGAGGSGSAPGGSGGSGSGSGGGTPPPSSSTGGVLGVVANLLSPIPLVGGSNGLVALVTQVLTGPPTTVAAPSTNSTASTASAKPSGLVGTVVHLLG